MKISIAVYLAAKLAIRLVLTRLIKNQRCLLELDVVAMETVSFVFMNECFDLSNRLSTFIRTVGNALQAFAT